MSAYIVRRTLQMLLTLMVFLTLVFFIVRLTGSPAEALAPVDATAEDVQLIERELGLDRPLVVQYALYIKTIFSGSFGTSVKSIRPVGELLLEHGINTLKLALTALFLGIVGGVPLGVVSAVKRFTPIESVVRFIAVVGLSVPLFWLGIVLMFLVAVRWGLVPAGGMQGPSSFILPGIVMSSGLMAGITRLLRSALLDVFDSDYVRLARLKGLSERRVVWKHALRNAMHPVLGFGSVYMALFLTGSVVTETVFAWPGLGRLMYDSLLLRDFPVLQGTVIVFVAVALLINLFIDVLYSLLDPRIRLQ